MMKILHLSDLHVEPVGKLAYARANTARRMIELTEWLAQHKDEYDAFLFVTYLYYLTVAGLPEVAEKAIFIPTAHEEPYLHFKTFEKLFQLPQSYVFLTEEERMLVRRQFKTAGIPCDVLGTGVDIPD